MIFVNVIVGVNRANPKATCFIIDKIIDVGFRRILIVLVVSTGGVNAGLIVRTSIVALLAGYLIWIDAIVGINFCMKFIYVISGVDWWNPRLFCFVLDIIIITVWSRVSLVVGVDSSVIIGAGRVVTLNL